MKTLAQLKQETQVPVIIVDEQGFVTYINQCFEEVYLWSSDLIGKTLLDVIPDNFHDAHNLGFSRFSMTEKSNILNHPINVKVITRDGRAVWSEHWLIAGAKAEIERITQWLKFMETFKQSQSKRIRNFCKSTFHPALCRFSSVGTTMASQRISQQII